MKRFFAAYFGNLAAMCTVAIILVLIGTFRAEAQEIPCAPTGVIEQRLEGEFGETPRASLVAPVPGGEAHLWTNGATGTYSVLIHPEPGLTCLLDEGQSDSLREWTI